MLLKSQMKKFAPIVGLVICFMLYTIYSWMHTESTDNAYVDSDILFLSPEINGVVKKLYVENNKTVSEGDIVCDIEDTLYKAEFKKAEVALTLSQNKLLTTDNAIESAEIMIEKMESNLKHMKVSLQKSHKNLERASILNQDKVATRQFLDDAQLAYEKSDNDLNQAIFDLEKARTQLDALLIQYESEREEVRAAEAVLSAAEHNYHATELKAPVSGTVASNSLRTGGFVRQGMPVIAIVPHNVYVTANFKETQVKKFVLGQNVEVRVDTFSDTKIDGTIKSIYPATGSRFSLIPTDNATGNFTKIVQRIPVIIDIDIPDELRDKIKPGMSAEVKVHVD